MNYIPSVIDIEVHNPFNIRFLVVIRSIFLASCAIRDPGKDYSEETIPQDHYGEGVNYPVVRLKRHHSSMWDM